MKEKIRNAVDELKGLSGQQEKTIKFEHASFQDKYVKGEITLSKLGTINLQLTDIKGYSPSYINQTANAIFKQALMPDPTVGSVLWTKRSESGLVIGHTYTLNSGSYYFGVGENPYLNCNGRPLFQSVQAKYQQKMSGSCKPDTGRDYTLFKIVQS
jgi:hypothetical protein